MESPGTKYGRLTLVSVRPDRSPDNHIVAEWKCDCGTKKDIAISRVRNGRTKSCGCLQVALARASHTVHGMRDSPEYSSWGAMKSRCLNPECKDFARYGAKGISIFPAWIDSFESFFAHVGKRPPGTTLERNDTLKGYEPGNVCWATPVEQACNRKNSRKWFIEGVEFASAEIAAAHFGVSDVTIHRWVKGAFDPRRGKSTPPKENCFVANRY